MLADRPSFLPAPSFGAIGAQRPDMDAMRARYDGFLARLNAASGLEEWSTVLHDWDAERRDFNTWENLTELRFRQDTADPSHKQELDFLNAARPKVTGFDVEMKRRFLDSPVRSELESSLGTYLFERWATDVLAYDPAIESLTLRESELENRYTELLSSVQIEFRGERYNLTGIAKFAESPDRATREAATVAKWKAYETIADELDSLYAQLVSIRDEMARAMKFDDYVGLGYKRMLRTDYTPDDVAAYRREIVASIVPLAKKIRERQAQQLGVDRLMYWDESIFDAAGGPVPPQSLDGMLDGARTTFKGTNAAIDTFARMMMDGGFLDLVNRPTKSGGGFCTWFPRFGRPFIFANFNGTTHDVNVLAHEMGHAFQCYSSREKKVIDFVWPTYDAAEIHSMSMEFFTAPHLEAFFGSDAERYRAEHLQTSILFLPYGAAVDDFQHFAYRNPNATPKERHDYWREVERTYLPWRQYGDIAFLNKGGLWQQQRHIYASPFYYIDYTLAMACALQFWMQSRGDYGDALERYTALCARGGEAPFQALARSAGLRSPFESGVLASIAEAGAEVLSLS